jgi:hypothetical protein
MLLKRALIILLALVLLVATGWGTLVLLYAGPAIAVWGRASLATVYAVGSLAALAWLRPLRRALAIWGVGMFAILTWWSMLRPSNDGDWQQDVAKLSWVEVHGDSLTVHNVRNFDYHTGTDFAPHYEERVYDLSKLRGFDIFLSYWGSRAIAHTIVSWDFADSPPLAISIETRKQKGQQYSAIEGFFRQYELIYVAADERDIVRVRTNYRGEDVYLYKVKATPEQARLLLMDYAATMNALDDTPEFYRAMLESC